jgi:hypothetical protein
MQKYRLENGRLLVGREALKDTMKDLIIDSLSALAVVLIGYSGVKLKIEKKVEEIKGEIDANR